MDIEECGPELRPGYWINRTSRLLTRLGDVRLEPFEIALSHLPVLRALGDGGSRSQSELARLAQVEQPSMAATLSRMERAGIVQREAHPTDKRAALVSLTRKARTSFPKAARSLDEAEELALAGLSIDERRTLRLLLERVAHNLENALEDSDSRRSP